MRKIIYLGHYETRNNPRNCSPAGVTMMDYISSTIRRNGYNLEIISPAQSEKELPGIEEIIDNSKIVFLSSHGIKKTIIQRGYSKLRREKELLYILDKHVGSNDVVIAYHSLQYIKILKKLRRKKKFKFILQVNEIYADVLERSVDRQREIQWLSQADAYIFSTERLKDIVKCSGKKYVICPGTYQVEPIRDVCREEQKMKDKINVVYSGTFDFRKGGGLQLM